MSRVAVIGVGYLGAVHAACMAEFGHHVVAIDSDVRKVAQLASGLTPIYEPGLEDLLRRGVASGRLTFTTDYARASDCDVHFICVGTPQLPGEHGADTSFVFDAIR